MVNGSLFIAVLPNLLKLKKDIAKVMFSTGNVYCAKIGVIKVGSRIWCSDSVQNSAHSPHMAYPFPSGCGASDWSSQPLPNPSPHGECHGEALCTCPVRVQQLFGVCDIPLKNRVKKTMQISKQVGCKYKLGCTELENLVRWSKELGAAQIEGNS